MRITALETRQVRVNRRGDWLFVLPRTDAGLTGLSEASHGGGAPDRDRLLTALLRQQAAPLLIGRDPRQVRAAVAALAPLAEGLPGWSMPGARSPGGRG